MPKRKNSYYVVWKGRQTGIFTDWEQCKAQIMHFEQAQYKGFPTLEEAESAFKQGYWATIHAQNKGVISSAGKNNPSIIRNSLAVDAACSGNPGKMEYRGVDVASGKELFHQGPFDEGTNNIGEFLAIVHGLAYLKQINSAMPLYTDSMTALAWIRAKKCRSKLERTAKNNVLFDLVERAEIWLKQNSYTTSVLKWDSAQWGEIPADFGRK
ncbi:viroplasmin family protein [Microbacter margulisiae]|uniref:Ribonuclease H n=1 Tax=Microbacter margulisiae TaxID=1350067 RepID=A0A7W5H1S1_9PORP|nr:ribonuclease H family protein [Microbacter margulisiae]MBB3186904.1 ribonuclease HI [Microbacter margulisiae]